MRGVVSFTAALAIPHSIGGTADDQSFPYRPLILFLTFMVILATLVVQGLPLVIRWLGVTDDGAMEQEEREARPQANCAALARFKAIGEQDPGKLDALERLWIEYEDHIRQVEGAKPEKAGTPLRFFSSEFERLSQEALQVERRTILELRNRNIINDDVLRRI
jgi:CPA1 family monovalent cation:H+ antiporter